LLAPNRAGKSSVVDALLYTIYNTTSKNARKNLNIVNQNKTTGRGYVEIEVGDKLYRIERTTEKYEKVSKGGSILEAKTMVEFSVKYEDGTIESLNGVSRQDTDRNIRRVFGEIDDFLLTSLSSQFGSLSYINEGSTKRKEILARFLDLEIFDRKFKMAKEEVGEIKGTLKRLESKDFDSEIEETKEKLTFNKERLEQEREKCSTIKGRIINVDSEIRKCEMSIASTPVAIINIDKTEKSLKLNEEELEAVEKRTASLKEEVAENKLQIQKIEDFLSSTFDIDGYKEKKELIRDKTKEQDLLNWEIKTKQKELKDREKRTKLLGEVPCEDKYPGCKLLKDSHRAAEEAKTLAKELLEIEEAREKINTLISDLEPEKIDGYLEKYEKLVNRKNDLSSTLSTKEISRQKNKTKIEVLNQKIAECKAQQAEYYKNKEAIENLGNIKEEKKQHEKELKTLNNQLDSCDKNVLEHVKILGSVEQKLKDLEKQKEELSTLRKQYEAYDLFLRCMHSDGITYGIIKKRLPVINNEIAKVLANIANFEVFFENEGRKLLIYIKHPKFEPRPLELGSGAEKSISAMAIRLALISVSSLPKPDLMVLDEPGTALDSEMLEGFSRIVELVKVQFKTVIIISHLDSLKDAVDQQIIIEKTKNGYSKIKH
jgi:exonuclease SbcC